MESAVGTNYHTTYQTPFKLPLWSEWTVNVKSAMVTCCTCSTASLKDIAIQALFKYLKLRGIFHDLPLVLQENHIPAVLYVDAARRLFAQKHWNVLKSLVSHWPYETFSLAQIIDPNFQDQNCWLSYLDSEDVDDPEREGGDTERQLLRKVFKNILDGYFSVVKSTLENGQKSPLRVLDLTLDPSQSIQGFMWEEEFRRLGRRVIKSLDVCLLAGLHKQAQKKFQDKHSHTENVRSSPVDWSASVGTDLPATQENAGSFEISTWSHVSVNSNQSKLSHHFPEARETIRCRTNASPEIGVWNGNLIDLSHLSEMPLFTVIIDASISEKSSDILTWIRQRYEDFLPAPSPVNIQIRFLEVSLHEERKFDAFVSRLPDHLYGLKLAEICEKNSAITLTDFLPRFQVVRYLDLGSCAFDLTETYELASLMAEALSQLRHLERLSLAHNCITDCLSTLLSGLELGLKLLDLSSCSLSEDDLMYLTKSIHSQSLSSLSLASNELGLKWDSVVNLAENMSPNLHILDLSSNDFLESQLESLSHMTVSSSLSSLALLDLSWHEIRLSTLLNIVKLLSSQTDLRTFCLSTPVDMSEAGYSELDSWQRFIDFTSQYAAKYRKDSAPLLLHWCLM